MAIAVSKYEEALSALQSLDAGVSRKDWVRISTSAKAAGITFEDWHAWCAGADNYAGEKDCRSNWNTIKEDGKITAGTLFHLARNTGWKPPRSAQSSPAPAGKPAKRSPAAAPRAAPPQPARAASAEDGPVDVHRIKKLREFLAAAKDAPQDHRYLVRKAVPGDRMKVARIEDYKKAFGYHPEGKKGELEGECLLIPLHTLDGELASMEMIDPDGRKSAVARLRRKGSCYSPVLPFPDTLDRIGVCEGVATCQTLNATAGHLVVSAGAQGNIEPLVLELAERYPRTEIIIYPDRGAAQELEAAALAASVLGQSVPMPSDVAGSDYNDMAGELGEDKVRYWIEHHLVRGGTRVRFGTARKTGRFNIPEVIPGLAVGSVGLVVGDDLAGLTALSLSVAACVALGRDVFTRSGDLTAIAPTLGESAKVTVLLGADPLERLHNQILDMGKALNLGDEDLATLDRQIVVSALEGTDMQLLPHQTGEETVATPFGAHLERMCASSQLTIIAPACRLGGTGSLEGAAGAAAVLEATRIAKRTHSAVLLLHHDPVMASQGPESTRRSIGHAVRWQGRLTTRTPGQRDEGASPSPGQARIWRWQLVVDRPTPAASPK